MEAGPIDMGDRDGWFGCLVILAVLALFVWVILRAHGVIQ